MSEITLESLVEIQDDEIPKIEAFAAKIRDRWTGKPNTLHNVTEMIKEMDEGMRELGFIVLVGPLRGKLTSQGEYLLPSFAIVERVKPFDVEQHADAVKKGVADPFWDRMKSRARRTLDRGVHPPHHH
jgi:hypothetical protein